MLTKEMIKCINFFANKPKFSLARTSTITSLLCFSLHNHNSLLTMTSWCHLDVSSSFAVFRNTHLLCKLCAYILSDNYFVEETTWAHINMIESTWKQVKALLSPYNQKADYFYFLADYMFRQ